MDDMKDIEKTSESRREANKERTERTVKKCWNALIIITFCVIIFGMMGLRIILPVPTVSLAENRELKVMPSADAGNIFFGSFTKDFENYYADTFPLRDGLLNTADYVSFLYKIPLIGVDSVVVMNNNAADSEEAGDEETEPEPQRSTADVQPEDTASAPEQTAQDFSREKSPKGVYLMTDTAIYKQITINSKQYGRWADGVNRLHKALPDRRLIVMSPPNSFAFYADKKYINKDTDQKAGIEDFYSKFDDGIYKVNTWPYLEEHMDDYIYFRTDHHWTDLGAYQGYTAFCDTLGLKPLPLEATQKNTFDRDFLGSNFMQLKSTAKAVIIEQNPDYVDYYIPPAKCSVTMYNKEPLKNGKEVPMFDLDLPPEATNCYLIFLGGDYPGLKIETDTKNGKLIVLLKDSFANSFAPYLTANYQYIYIVDFRDYNAKGKPKFSLEKFVNDNDIDDVLLVLNFEFVNDPSYVDWYLKSLP